MLHMPIKDVIEKIKLETRLSESEIKDKIRAKVESMESLVSEEGAAYIIASEMGVSLFKEIDSGALKINNILAGMNNVEVIGKIIRVRQPITFNKNGKTGEVASLIIGDESGTIRVVLWDDRINWIKEGKLREGAIIKIKDAYVKENSYGNKELHINNRSKLLLEPEGIKISVPDFNQENQATKLLATVVRIFRPRFYRICAECGKKVTETDEGFICTEHKIVKSQLAMVLSLILDNGQETTRAVAFGKTAEQLSGLNAKEAQDILTKDGELSLIERLDDFLLGKTIEAEGRLNENKAFERMEFNILRINLNPNPRAIALEKLEGE